VQQISCDGKLAGAVHANACRVESYRAGIAAKRRKCASHGGKSRRAKVRSSRKSQPFQFILGKAAARKAKRCGSKKAYFFYHIINAKVL
jgi:hypothetical protein